MGRKVRWAMLAVVVALAGVVPVALMSTPAGATTASVSTVAEFWDAWTDANVTQIDLENSIDLITFNSDTSDYSTCKSNGGIYPERDPNGPTLVDGHGFTLTMTCDHNAVLDLFGGFTLTVQNITLTHSGAPTPTVGGNGIAMEGSGSVVVLSSTITGNWVEDDTCSDTADVGTASLCIPVGGGIAADGDVNVTGSTISNNRAPGRGGGIYSNGLVTVTSSVVSENHATDDPDSFNAGGGILANGGVVIDNVAFTDNVVGCDGGCTALGGAIFAVNATITNSSFTSNVAGCEGECSNYGGAVYDINQLTLSGSTLTDNRATCENACAADGGGVAATGSEVGGGSTAAAGRSEWAGAADGDIVPGPVVITDTLFDGNLATTTDTPGGNCDCEGGGLYVDDETSVTVTGSTFTGNTAYYAGGAMSLHDETPLAVTNSTITANTSAGGAISSDGGGVTLAYDTVTDNVLAPVTDLAVDSSQYFDGPSAGIAADDDRGAAVTLSGVLRAFGTVVTGSTGGPNCLVDGSTTSDGWNFSDDTSCGFTNTAAGDSEAATNDPKLGAVAANGGPTPTQLPQGASPLIDAVPTAVCQTGPAAGVAVDQRGVTRPQMLGCDIGSVEVEAPPVAIEPTFTG